MPLYAVSRESGALVRVNRVDDTFAYIETLWDPAQSPARAAGGAQDWGSIGRWSMPIDQYHRDFAKWHRPAEESDLAALDGGGIALPANAGPEWRDRPSRTDLRNAIAHALEELDKWPSEPQPDAMRNARAILRHALGDAEPAGVPG